MVRAARGTSVVVAGLLPPQHAVAAFEPEVFDGGPTRLADSQPVQAERHCKGSLVAIEAFCGEQEHHELGALQTTRLGWM